MLARLWSASLVGVDASLVQVEVDVSFGLPTFGLVGLPDSSVRESRDRVRSAVKNSGFEFPDRRITVNLAPADVPKRGTAFDLPIAIGILAASGAIARRAFADYLIIGELSLDGSVQSARGVLPVALTAKRHRLTLLLPRECGPEAALVRDLQIGLVSSLTEAAAVLDDTSKAEAPPRPAFRPDTGAEDCDLADVKGQQTAKRALEVAAAGRHNVLFVGPPGAGKTLIAQRLPGILPPLSFDEAVETTAVYSVLGLVPASDGVIRARPFRAPHHSASSVALVGGGRDPRPGEVSLAHNGVLFLDEVPEFGRRALEGLRQPLESLSVTITRASRAARFPARFMLVCAMNPCPCGFAGSATRPCHCTPAQIDQYRGRLSGPLRDRIDLTVPVAPIGPTVLAGAVNGEASESVRRRVVAARRRQIERYRGLPYRTNADLRHRRLASFCQLGTSERRVLEQAVVRFGLSARAYDRVRRVARTIADLEGADDIGGSHLAEALGYRLQADL